MVLTGSSGAAVERCKQRSEHVQLGEGGPLCYHGEHRPGGDTLKLLDCQLVFKVEESKYLEHKDKLSLL